jgi:hypothetical protein
MVKTNNAANGKIIFSPQLANYLLSRGHSIIKLKPKKDNVRESVFVFAVDDNLFEAISDWLRQGNSL